MLKSLREFRGRRRIPPSPVSDEALIDRLRSGDMDALEELLDQHWEVVLDYAARLTRCVDSAEDLAQQAFVALWEGRKGWEEGTRPRPLLLRMVRNRSLNESRRHAVRNRFEGKVLSIEAARRPPDPLEELEAKELETAFCEALNALSPRRREVFQLARFQGLTYSEIADVLGTSPQTVANQLSGAFQELRRAMDRFGSRRTAQ